MSNCELIPANPDITGIGVRTAIYAQNILSILSAGLTLIDRKVTPIELEAVETQSLTILITAFAILFSAIIQTPTLGLTNYHATIILNLSWINNTNTFIYLIIYFYRRAAGARSELMDAGRRNGRLVLIPEAMRPFWDWTLERKKLFVKLISFMGSFHLSLMAAIGIWVWSNPFHFGDSPSCSMSASIVVLGRGIPLASKGLRVWSLFIYGLLLIPALNMILPIMLFTGLFSLSRRLPRLQRFTEGVTPVLAGLVVLLAINIIFLVDTEATIKRNLRLVESGDKNWTFGQTLALLLLLIPVRDLIMTALEIRQKKLGKELLQAASEDKLDIIRDHLNRGANINVQDSEGHTALLRAADRGHTKIVRVLVEGGADVKVIGKTGWTVLHCAACDGHSSVIDLLAEKGVEINARDSHGWTAISHAASNGHSDVVRALVDRKADVNVKDSSGWTALSRAAQGGHREIVQQLVEEKADVNNRDSNKRTALSRAAQGGHLEVVEYLVQHGASVNDKDDFGQSALSHAAYMGPLDIVQYLAGLPAAERARVNDKDHNGQTPISHAARHGYLEIVQFLAGLTADINDKDNGGQTAFSHAARGGHSEVMQWLTENGAHLNSKDHKGHIAIPHAHHGRFEDGEV